MFELPDHPLFDRKNWTFQNVLEVLIQYAMRLAAVTIATIVLWVCSVVVGCLAMLLVSVNSDDAMTNGVAWGTVLLFPISLILTTGVLAMAQGFRESRTAG